MNQYHFFVFCSFLVGLVLSDISREVDSTLEVNHVTQGRNICPSVPSSGVSCFYMGRLGSKIYNVWAGMTNQGRNTRALWDLPPLCPQTHLSSYLDKK